MIIRRIVFFYGTAMALTGLSHPVLFGQIRELAYKDIKISGELEARSIKNFDRLESDIYTPDKVFPIAHEGVSAGWPGDYEGRIILGLTLQAQATHREPKYLSELIDRLDTQVNEMGYLGPAMKDSILEQQLSGHGWLLRGLCEYYQWKRDERVEKHIKNIVANLALPTKGYHRLYPIDPKQRLHGVGEASGTTQNAVGNWLLSSDIGCDFIFMDGVIHAYSLFPDPKVKALIEEMIQRFLEMDLIGIKAQTHATLTALRGLLRYYSITNQGYLLREAIKRYELYNREATTENFENFNWFGRPEWTEPCAIIDAFMVATQLWQYCGEAGYLADAHRIYYNALAHTQRANGGFGLDNCPGLNDDVLKVYADEAYWCCTMRGGEGLATAIRYNYFTDGRDNIYIPFFNNSEVEVTMPDGKATLIQRSGYPYKGNVELEVLDAQTADKVIRLHLLAPEWAVDPTISVNGRPMRGKHKNGFLMLKTTLRKGDRIRYTFDMSPQVQPLANKAVKRPGYHKIVYGPLVLGYQGKGRQRLRQSPDFDRLGEAEWKVRGEAGITLSPVFHVLDPEVTKKSGYEKQLIFEVKEY